MRAACFGSMFKLLSASVFKSISASFSYDERQHQRFTRISIYELNHYLQASASDSVHFDTDIIAEAVITEAAHVATAIMDRRAAVSTGPYSIDDRSHSCATEFIENRGGPRRFAQLPSRSVSTTCDRQRRGHSASNISAIASSSIVRIGVVAVDYTDQASVFIYVLPSPTYLPVVYTCSQSQCRR